MVKINGAWKISLADVMAHATAERVEEVCGDIVEAVERIEEDREP